MSFFVQQGYGKSQKIGALNATGALAGIILSPADEDPATLAATAATSRAMGLQILVDCQTYIHTSFPPGQGRNHSKHDLQFNSIHWSQDVNATQAQLDSIRRVNQLINPDGDWIAPSAAQASFADVWTPLSLQFARTASENWGGTRTFASVVIDESAFATWPPIDDWLDVATTLDVKGFYVLIGRSNTGYPPVAWSPDRLANVLRFIYNLTGINGYQVIWGYSDAEGLLGLAAGASDIASGWSFGLRQFSTAKWIPTTGGRPAVVRLPLPSIWSSVRASGEALDLFESDLRDRIFSSNDVNEFAARDFSTISRSEAQDRYLSSIARAAKRLDLSDDITVKLDSVEGSLSTAVELFSEIESRSIVLEPRYRPRVTSLLEAVRRFRAVEGV